MTIPTANQLVAVNLRRLRKERGWSQDELGAKLGWGKSVVSTAERSADARRVRQFSIEDTVLIADVLGVGITDLLEPVTSCPCCGDNPPEGFTCNACGICKPKNGEQQ
jgi:transcriptional regulator with XRE-family HTH domain